MQWTLVQVVCNTGSIENEREKIQDSNTGLTVSCENELDLVGMMIGKVKKNGS